MIKLCGAVCIVAGTTCYGLFYAFQKKSRLWRLKQFKESLLCLSGQLRVARMTMPQALAQIGQKSRYDYLSQFYIFVSENLEQHTYSGFWETWAAGIDSYRKYSATSGHSDAACLFGRKYFGTGESD